jgi:photosynthetic reaction center H subunit
MESGAITGYIDVAQLVLYGFWIFFFALIIYLQREGKREGFPLEADTGTATYEGFPAMPDPKTYILPDGSDLQVPTGKPEPALKAKRVAAAPGSPYEPDGDPMLAGMGPGSWANREDVPDTMWNDGSPRLRPLRMLSDWHTDSRDPNPVGMDLVGCDGKIGGRIVDVWADRAEHIIRYYEFEKIDADEPTPAPAAEATAEGEEGTEAAASAPAPTRRARRGLVPVTFTQMPWTRSPKAVKVNSIKGEHFANVPELANPDQITRLEEDRICAYYGAGHLFAEPKRRGPLL